MIWHAARRKGYLSELLTVPLIVTCTKCSMRDLPVCAFINFSSSSYINRTSLITGVTDWKLASPACTWASVVGIPVINVHHVTVTCISVCITRPLGGSKNDPLRYCPFNNQVRVTESLESSTGMNCSASWKHLATNALSLSYNKTNVNLNLAGSAVSWQTVNARWGVAGWLAHLLLNLLFTGSDIGDATWSVRNNLTNIW